MFARMTAQPVAKITALACWCGLLAVAGGQEAPEAEAAREARLKAMYGIAQRFNVQVGEGAERKPVPLMESPILRFNDPAREFHDATLWAWGDAGRPLCLLAIEQYGDRSWYECISLAGDKLSADADGLKWPRKGPGITLSPFPDAPP